MKRLDKKSASASGDVGVPQSLSPQASAVETSMGADYGSTEHHLPEIVRDCNKRGSNGWYASLSDQRKEEHLRKLRISRKQKRAAALDVNVNEGDLAIGQNGSTQSELTRVVDTPSGRLNLDEGGCDDWLHRNPTYIRQDRPTEHIVPTSFISGRNIEPIDAYNEKERHRKKTKYSEMSTQQKDALLDRNRAYKLGKRRGVTLSNKYGPADVACGSGYQSPHTPAIEVQPSYGNSHTVILMPECQILLLFDLFFNAFAN